MIVVALAVVLVFGPLLLGLSGLFHARRGGYRSPEPAVPWNWKQTISSALLYTLAFNLTFFIQELFLVLPKALIPGVRPTLFHNNHSWEGENPLTSLFQGTGALAILLSGVVCALLLQRRSPRSATVRLFLIWMTYNGLFQALPQVVIGAISPQNDVGMAIHYLRLGSTARTAAALVALALIPPAALWLTRHLLGAAERAAQLSSARERTRFIFQVATLPALLAVVLIIPFRIPRELIEVVGPPVVVSLVGMVWVQAGAWRFDRVTSRGEAGAGSIAYPLSAVLGLLLVFQLFLKPGIPFYQVELINLEWLQPGNGQHRLFAASGDITDGVGHLLVTAYPVPRPDGNWALLVVNKDQENAHKVAVRFDDPDHHGGGGFAGPVSAIVFGKAEYHWRPDVDGGTADPDGPPAAATVNSGPDTTFMLPPASITVLRGKVAMREPLRP